MDTNCSCNLSAQTCLGPTNVVAVQGSAPGRMCLGRIHYPFEVTIPAGATGTNEDAGSLVLSTFAPGRLYDIVFEPLDDDTAYDGIAIEEFYYEGNGYMPKTPDDSGLDSGMYLWSTNCDDYVRCFGSAFPRGCLPTFHNQERIARLAFSNSTAAEVTISGNAIIDHGFKPLAPGKCYVDAPQFPGALFPSAPDGSNGGAAVGGFEPQAGPYIP